MKLEGIELKATEIETEITIKREEPCLINFNRPPILSDANWVGWIVTLSFE